MAEIKDKFIDPATAQFNFVVVDQHGVESVHAIGLDDENPPEPAAHMEATRQEREARAQRITELAEEHGVEIRIFEATKQRYPFPQIHLQDGQENPLFVSKKVLVDRHDRPTQAIFGRKTIEGFLLLDPSHGTPTERAAQFEELHRAAMSDLWNRGFDDAHCWLAPAYKRRFADRLKGLGWIRDDDWTPYCLYLRP